jgi:N-acetylglucosaminyl-diphospho-decaprenol L-rhamnosyltransferase
VVRLTTSLSIVVVSHDSGSDLPHLLESTHRQLGDEAQVVVVDTASSDGSPAVARSAGAEVVELAHNPGFGPANNLGLTHARGEITALLNPDIELSDDGLARLVELASGQRALFVPRLVGHDGVPQKTAHPVPGRPAAFGFALLGPALPRRARLHAEPWRSQRPVRVGWAIAAALVAQTDVLRTLGPFDPEAFLFYEDLDLCLRAAQDEVPTILHPEVVLRHAGAHATGPAFGGEPYELLAQRRREVVGARLGRRSLVLDDAAQAVTFTTRALARVAIGRSPGRPLEQLRALRRARRTPDLSGERDTRSP